MAVSSSPTAPGYPSLCLHLNKREDLLKKPGNLQVGAFSSLVYTPLWWAQKSLPIIAVLKPVSTEKENVEKTVLAHPDHEFKLLREDDECQVIRGDKEQGFIELKRLEKEDLLAICCDVSTIYEMEYLGLVTAEAPLVMADVPPFTAKIYTLENPVNQPEGLYMTTVNPLVTVPTKHLDFDFVKIQVFSIDGQELSLAAELNTVGTNHDIDMDENQLDGMMSRGVYNTSGGTIMWHVLHEFQPLTLDRETMQQRDTLELKLADLVHSGILSDPLREAIYIFMDNIAETTIGSVQIKFYRASVTVTQDTSPE